MQIYFTLSMAYTVAITFQNVVIHNTVSGILRLLTLLRCFLPHFSDIPASTASILL